MCILKDRREVNTHVLGCLSERNEIQIWNEDG